MKLREELLVIALVPVVVAGMLTLGVLSAAWDRWTSWRGVRGCPP